MNKNSVLITPDVIEECLCECLDNLENRTAFVEKATTSHYNSEKSSK